MDKVELRCLQPVMKASMTKVELDALGKSTTLESNKNLEQDRRSTGRPTAVKEKIAA